MIIIIMIIISSSTTTTSTTTTTTATTTTTTTTRVVHVACRQVIAVLRLADSNACTLVCGGFSTDKHANYMQQLQEIHKSYHWLHS